MNFQSYCSKRRKTGLIKRLFRRTHKISSQELFSDKIIVVKYILQKNGYPCTLADIFRTLESKRLVENKINFGQEKGPVVLVLPYFGTKSSVFETDETVYFAKSRVNFKSSPMFTPKGKYRISLKITAV